MPSEKDLTIILHRNFCTPKGVWCEWYNEVNCEGDVWEQPTHKRWLEKARYVIKGSNHNINQIMEAIDTINEVKMLLEK